MRSFLYDPTDRKDKEDWITDQRSVEDDEANCNELYVRRLVKNRQKGIDNQVVLDSNQ